MPNYSSSSVSAVEWAMSFDGCSPVKKRNLLENLQVLTDTTNTSKPIPPPPFQDFISVTNTKKRTLTNSSVSSDGNYQLPHQTPSPSLDHKNYKYAKIRARPLYNFKYHEASIWTQSSPNSIHPLLTDQAFDIKVLNKFFAQEAKPKVESPPPRSRSSSVSTNGTLITGPYQLLEKSSQITYDVTMRHLLQLLNKVPGRTATLDDVIQGIDTGSILNEWLQCVQRLVQTLRKQFIKRPEDEEKFSNFPLENLETLNLVEQFFVKLIHLPDYELKLKSYQYRDEFQSQLEFLHQSIDRFSHGIDLVLHHQYLPWLFQVLCFLYNLVSNKSVPGLDLISLEDALNSPTNQSNKTVAHVLAQILDEYYPEHLTNIIHDEQLIDLKKLSTIKYEKIYAEIREIFRNFQQLQTAFRRMSPSDRLSLPSFISSMLEDAKRQFEEIFGKENFLQRGERDLATYFCSNDLSLDYCLATVGHCVEKIRLAHRDNRREKKKF